MAHRTLRSDTPIWVNGAQGVEASDIVVSNLVVTELVCTTRLA